MLHIDQTRMLHDFFIIFFVSFLMLNLILIILIDLVSMIPNKHEDIVMRAHASYIMHRNDKKWVIEIVVSCNAQVSNLHIYCM